MPSIGDLLFALAQWLKTTELPELALWMAKTPASQLVDSSMWVAELVQTTHILAIAASFGAAMMILLRLAGVTGSDRTVRQTLDRYMPWIWWGLLVLLVTGVILIIGEPARELLNPAFWSKMVLVAVGALGGLWFQASVRRNPAAWELGPQHTAALRAGAAAVFVLCFAIMMLGRWIAYAPV
jgi:hypothetical protein